MTTISLSPEQCATMPASAAGLHFVRFADKTPFWVPVRLEGDAVTVLSDPVMEAEDCPEWLCLPGSPFCRHDGHDVLPAVVTTNSDCLTAVGDSDGFALWRVGGQIVETYRQDGHVYVPRPLDGLTDGATWEVGD